ncbi:alpha/beta hydrolase [Nocardioides solisilvae]|uniref:alpha/beta hydrolase n=1 Tax=Nocardioides solisilvae TaxID=1542435 RepID=UPI000D746771|nr:alpha/beta fold hydrolase [Nocardioides solisilvae]
MPLDPTAAPLSLPADPARTGGRSIGVLLSHGFTGSPASVRPWGQALAAHGYAVEVPRLPGHGTSWQELNATTWDDWYGEVERTFDRLRAQHDAVVVGGLSMGGALTLRLAADRGDQVAGLVVVNAAVHTTRKDVLALPLLKHVVPSLPGIADDIRKPGVREHGYTRTPLRATHSMMTAWKRLRADLGAVTCPLLFLKSEVDHVVDPSSVEIVRRSVSSTDVTVRTLTESWHVATLDHDAPVIEAETAAFVARVTR